MTKKSQISLFIIRGFFIAIMSQYLLGCSGIRKEGVSEDKTYLTPIPRATLSAYRYGMPITNKLEAVIAAQIFLPTARMSYDELPKVISVEEITLDKANKKFHDPQPGDYYYEDRPGNTIVWLIMFEGNWRIESPFSDPTPEAFWRGCAYVIIDKDGRSGTRTIACPE
jgi:hypothetical protein